MSRRKKLKYSMSIMGLLILILGVIMLLPMAKAYHDHDPSIYKAFFLTSVCSILIGIFTSYGFKKNKDITLRPSDAYTLLTLGWIAASLLTALPFLLSNFSPTPASAIFESVSGLTTTSSTASSASHFPESIILYKALLNYVGGLGLMLLLIAFLSIDRNSQTLARLEAAGPRLIKLTSKMSDTARIIYATYAVFTAAEFLLLMLFPKMRAFEAFVNSLTSISTGGLFNKSFGLYHLGHWYVDIVISVFTIIGSVNFLLYYFLIKGKLKKFFANIELLWYIKFIVAFTLIIAVILYGFDTFDSPFRCIKASFVQVTSTISTTGIPFYNYSTWPATAKLLLTALAFIGSCSISTGGSIKIIRILIYVKMIYRGFLKRAHPRLVVPLTIGGKPVEAPIVSAVSAFILAFIGIFILGGIVLSFSGLYVGEAFSTSISMLSNSGISFSKRFMTGDYSCLSGSFKLFLSLLMLLGRLELFPILILLMPSFLKKDN